LGCRSPGDCGIEPPGEPDEEEEGHPEDDRGPDRVERVSQEDTGLPGPPIVLDRESEPLAMRAGQLVRVHPFHLRVAVEHVQDVALPGQDGEVRPLVAHSHVVGLNAPVRGERHDPVANPGGALASRKGGRASDSKQHLSVDHDGSAHRLEVGIGCRRLLGGACGQRHSAQQGKGHQEQASQPPAGLHGPRHRMAQEGSCRGHV
jgi:hypothetical protein